MTFVALFALVVQPMYGLVAGQVASALTATVASQAELEAAIANTANDTIQLTGSFSVDKKVVINRSVTLNGGNNTITSTRNNNPNDNGNNAVLGIDATSGVTVRNLTVSRGSGQDIHGINVWRSTDVVLDNVTITGFTQTWRQAFTPRYGLVVGEDSQVTVNNIKTSGNSRGINVDKGTPKLTVTGQSAHSETLHIYVDSGNETYVDDVNGQYRNAGGMYSLKSEPNAPSITAPANGATITSPSAVVSWNAVAATSTRQAAAAYEYGFNGDPVVRTTDLNVPLAGLADGSHSFKVRSVSASGLVSGWTYRSFTLNIDQLPEATIATPAENGVVSTKVNGNKLRVTGTYTDD